LNVVGYDSIVKNRYQLIAYSFIFLTGYCSNFILPINYFSGRSTVAYTPDLSGAEITSNKKMEVDRGDSPNITNLNRKNISVSKGEPKALVSPHVMAGIKSSNEIDNLAALHSELAMLRDYRMQTEINKHNEYLQSIGGNTVEALNDNFKREPVDLDWAQEKEKLINYFVDQSEHLSQLPHMASECRSKQCRLSVLSDDQFYLDKLSISLDKIIADHGTSFSSYSTIIDEESHTTSVYFDRN
jgi:hypothetical protein